MAAEAQILTNRITLYAVRHTLPEIALYNYRGTSTNQPVFLQNKPNFRNAQMNVTSVKTMTYEQITMNNPGKKQSQNKPKQTQFPKRPNEPKF